MTNPIGPLALSALIAAAPALVRADDQPYWTQDGWDETASPAEAPPAEAPPAPPPAELQAQPAPAPQGQWVYTQQYGWIWMPYSDAYTHVPASGYGEPYAYVYYPASGWCWLAAPWVWGIGPWPFFGVWGPARFAWYGHGWWRHPGRWHYAPAHHPWGGYRGGHAPSRGWVPHRGSAISRPAPHAAYRGGFGQARGAAAAPSRGFVGGGHAFRGGHVSAPRGGGHISAPRSGGHASAPRGGGHAFAPRGGGYASAPRGGGHASAPRGGGVGGHRGR